MSRRARAMVESVLKSKKQPVRLHNENSNPTNQFKNYDVLQHSQGVHDQSNSCIVKDFELLSTTIQDVTVTSEPNASVMISDQPMDDTANGNEQVSMKSPTVFDLVQDVSLTSEPNFSVMISDQPMDDAENGNEQVSTKSSIVSDLNFSPGSSNYFNPNTDSSSSVNSICNSKRKNQKDNSRRNIVILDSEIEDSDSNFWESDGVIQGRKRKPRKCTKERRLDRETRKRLKNAGQSYETFKGKQIKAKEQKPLQQCRMKCANRISEEYRKDVFNYYWGLGTYEKRLDYIKSLIKIEETKTTRTNPKSTRKRRNTNYYSLKLAGQTHGICKGCLLKTLDESPKFIQITYENLLQYRANNEPKQGRGKQPSFKSLSESGLEEVKQHILSFPAYESHYCRSQSLKKYLSPELNLRKMYHLYSQTFENPVSETIYSWVFKAQNLCFKKPSLDICLKCNTLFNQIRVTEGDERTLHEHTLQEHHNKADSIYKKKTNDKNLSKQSNDTFVICFDLQQCLPTPFLKTRAAFYKRKLWTFNLTLRDCTNKKVYCFMWHEAVAGRGANQIGSCIYYYINKFVPERIKKLIFYSDLCSGQNKNSIVMAMFLTALHNTHVESITHNFFVPGHSHMECDVDNALIEKSKKRTQMSIHHPRDWYQLVRSCSVKNPFTVIEMTQDDFLDLGSILKGPLQLKKIDENKNKFNITDCEIFKYDKKEFPKIFFKRSDQEEFSSVDFERKITKSNINSSFENIPKLYNRPLPISGDKKKDLLSLLPLIDPSVRDFYRNLVDDKDLANIHPDLIESETEA